MATRDVCSSRWRTNAAAFWSTKAICFNPSATDAAPIGSGLGLGLSIARQAVRANAGDIHVRNMPGKGCIFTIDLPLAAAETVPQTV